MSAPKPIRIVREDIDPKEIAIEFLKHEMLKLYPPKSDAFDQAVKDLTAELPERLGDELFWKLVAGIAEGYMLKGIFRVITDSTFHWRLEELHLDDIRMTGMGGQLDRLLSEADWTPSKFAEVWAAQSDTFKEEEGLEAHERRDFMPIVLYEQDGELRVIDGMRRTCVAAIEGKAAVQAYVGRMTNPEGQSLISPDKVMYTMLLYQEAEEKPPHLLDSIKTVLIAYKKNYRNGPELVEEMVSPWLEDSKYRDVAREIIDA